MKDFSFFKNRLRRKKDYRLLGHVDRESKVVGRSEEMHNVELQTNSLVVEIKKSKEYSQYRRMLENVKKDTNLYHRISEYRKKTFFAQIRDDEDSLMESGELVNQFDDLAGNEVAMEFLEAELRYLKMIRHVNDKILDCMDLDIDFLEE